MEKRLFSLAGVILVAALMLPFGCSKDKTGPDEDPYRILSLYRWVYRYSDTVDGNTINVTISFNFKDSKLYQYKQVGLMAGDEVESYSQLETGTYEATMSEITFTPDEGEPYTIPWSQVTGSGDIMLTLRDGRLLQFTYLPVESW